MRQLFGDARADVALVAQRHHQALAAHFVQQLRIDPAQAMKAVLELFSALGRALNQVLLFEDGKHFQRDDTAEVAAAECGQVDEGTLVEEGQVVAAKHGCAQRIDATRDRLADGDHVRDHVPVLEGPELAGAAHATLHLVADEDALRAVAELAQPVEVAVGRDVDATFALDRLDDDGADTVIDRVAHRREVAEGHLPEVLEQRLEGLAKLRPARRRQGKAGVAVVGLRRRKHPGPARDRAGQLEGEVDRLTTSSFEHHAA